MPNTLTEARLNRVRSSLHELSRQPMSIEGQKILQTVLADVEGCSDDLDQAKSRFISVVTHELRVPMTSIKGYADLLRQGAVGALNDQQLGFINVIRSNVERMSALVSDLSDISRIEAGRLQLNCSMISLSVFEEESLRSLEPKLQEKHQTLKVNLPAELPEIYADRDRLVQVLRNLISNACKYTPPEGEICVSAHLQGATICIEVTDNGIGINPEDQIKVFTPFFRSEDPYVREEQGWGLGLNVAKLLVDLMEGEIGFQSVYGEGSTFWFTLPTSITEPDTSRSQGWVRKR